MSNKEKILKLRESGLSYSEIVSEVGCSKSTVCYHLGENQREKHYIRKKNNRENNLLSQKLWNFKNAFHTKPRKVQNQQSIERKMYEKIHAFHKTKTKNGNKSMKLEFTMQDVINKFGENPKCYLTGEQIDLNKPSTYQFDHIIPKSRGGNNSLENLGICTKKANQCKYNQTPDELLHFCLQVVENFGYKVLELEQ